MKYIKLTRGLFVEVDNSDYDYLNQWKWCALKAPGRYYAVRGLYSKDKSTILYMHRIILNVNKKEQVDHIDRNGLNCQRNNLRICSHSQNNMNRKASGSSKYLGVCVFKNRNKYIYIKAEIVHNHKRIYLGTYKTEEDAALAYNEAAAKYHGEFANLNIIKL